MADLSDVEIINRALGRIGALEITTINAPGPNGTSLGRTWATVRDDILSKYPWRFTLFHAALTRLPDAPVQGWLYAYQLPSDRIGPPRGYYDSQSDRRVLTRFDLVANTLVTDATAVWAYYQKRVPANYWPGYVVNLCVVALASEFAAQVRENWGLRAQLRKEVYGEEQYQGEGGQFKIAMDLDAQSAPASRIDGGRSPLARVRHISNGGIWWGDEAGDDGDDD